MANKDCISWDTNDSGPSKAKNKAISRVWTKMNTDMLLLTDSVSQDINISTAQTRCEYKIYLLSQSKQEQETNILMIWFEEAEKL